MLLGGPTWVVAHDKSVRDTCDKAGVSSRIKPMLGIQLLLGPSFMDHISRKTTSQAFLRYGPYMRGRTWFGLDQTLVITICNPPDHCCGRVVSLMEFKEF